jgi:hypothetical protein
MKPPAFRLALGRLLLSQLGLTSASHHQAHLLQIGVGAGAFTHNLPFVEDDNTVAQIENLFQFRGN